MSLLPILSLAQEDLDKLVQLDSGRNDKVSSTFKSGVLINMNTTEMLHKKELDFRVDHRFGDIAGTAGGPKNFFGLDNSTDIRIGFEYGVSDRINVGIARAKGSTAVSQLYEASLKYRFLEQTLDDRIPVSLGFFGSGIISAAGASQEKGSPISFQDFSHRITYLSQLILARKFSSYLSLVIAPTYVHRNFTAYGDQNSLFSIVMGGRLKLTKRMSLIADYFLPLRTSSKKKYMETTWNNNYFNALGIGLEMETGGHVFSLNFTNAKAIQLSQIITETNSSWTKGQFRWGFGISRRFSFDKKAKEPEAY